MRQLARRSQKAHPLSRQAGKKLVEATAAGRVGREGKAAGDGHRGGGNHYEVVGCGAGKRGREKQGMGAVVSCGNHVV